MQEIISSTRGNRDLVFIVTGKRVETVDSDGKAIICDDSSHCSAVSYLEFDNKRLNRKISSNLLKQPSLANNYFCMSQFFTIFYETYKNQPFVIFLYYVPSF